MSSEDLVVEFKRRQQQAEINGQAQAQPSDDKAEHRARLEAEYGQVWDTDQLSQDFEVIGFGAPLVVVRRRSDGVQGSLYFQHSPRLYWGFQEHRK